MLDEIDVTIADRDDEIPLELLDEIVSEYQQAVMFDGVQLVSARS